MLLGVVVAFSFRPINTMVTLLKLKKRWNSTCGQLIIGIELNPSSISKAECKKVYFIMEWVEVKCALLKLNNWCRLYHGTCQFSWYHVDTGQVINYQLARTLCFYLLCTEKVLKIHSEIKLSSSIYHRFPLVLNDKLQLRWNEGRQLSSSYLSSVHSPSPVLAHPPGIYLCKWAIKVRRQM